MEELLRKFWNAGVDHEATLNKKYSFEQTLADNAHALQLLQPDVSGRSEQLCGFFEADTKTTSATKCKCGREKWEHPKAT